MGQREIRERKRKGEIKGKWDFFAFILNRASERELREREKSREEKKVGKRNERYGKERFLSFGCSR